MATNKISIHRMTNANIIIGGNSMLGRASNIDLPVIKTTLTEHDAMGLIGKLDYPSGLDKLTARIAWNSFYKEVLSGMANPFTAIQLQLRSNVEEWEGQTRIAQIPFVAYIRGVCNDFPFGSFKTNDNVTLESNISLSAARLEYNGEEIYNVDIEANIWKVNGVDLLAQYRQNLGID